MEGPAGFAAPIHGENLTMAVDEARTDLGPELEVVPTAGGKRRRWSSQLSVRYRLADAPDESRSNDPFPTDIAGDCLFIRTSEELPVGTALRCDILREETGLSCRATAVVRYCRQSSRGQVGLGVEIVALDDKAWRRVADITTAYLTGATEKKPEKEKRAPPPPPSLTMPRPLELVTENRVEVDAGPRWKVVVAAAVIAWMALFAAFAA
jgi:hypothetical protein